MVTDAFNHAPAQLLMNTGTQQFGRPSMGAWATYGLGSETQDLPAFVAMSTGKKGPSAGNACWGAGFLPTVYAGVEFRGSSDPVLYLSNPRGVDAALQKDTIDTVNRLNRMRLDVTGDPEIATRISAFEMAYRMQSSAPELMDLKQEPQAVLDLYGADAGQAELRRELPARAAAGGARRALRADPPRGLGPARRARQGPEAELPRLRPGLRGARQGPEAARAARRRRS